MNLGSPAGFGDLTSFSVGKVFVFAKWENGPERPGTRVGENSQEAAGRGGPEAAVGV